MNLGGWITFLVSAGLFCALFTWCLYKVITTPRSDKLHGIEIDDFGDDS